MANHILGLLEKRAKLLAEARQMFDEAAGRGEVLAGEAKEKYDRMWADAKAIKEAVDQQEKLEADSGVIASDVDRLRAVRDAQTVPSVKLAEERALDVFRACGADISRLTPDARQHVERVQLEATEAYLRHDMAGLAGNSRYLAALNITDVTRGGIFKPPPVFLAGVIAVADQAFVIRQHATVLTDPTGEGFGAIGRQTDLSSFEWTVELPSTVTEDDALAFDSRELKPNPMRKLVKGSKDLVSRYPSLVSYVQSRLGYQSGGTMETGFITGNGTKQPLGMCTASAQGITTARDVTCGTATELVMDYLKAVKNKVRPPYRVGADCGWLAHSDFFYRVSLLKDGMQQYYWQPSIVQGEPDKLLAHPCFESELMPSTFTTSLYVGIFGNLKHYYVVDFPGGATLQRLVELYALTNQDGWIASYHCDGQPVLAEAFARLKMG